MTAAQSRPLFVADDDGEGQLITELFRRAGFATRALESGQAVLDAAREEWPAAVILGLRLPGLNGYEVCRELRDAYGDSIAIVFVSGERTEAFDRVAGLLIGADDYIVKPYDPAELIARVRRLVARAPRPAEDASDGDRLASLTVREREVLRLLASGRRSTDIAHELVISPKTVATHIQRVLRKLDVRDRTQAVAYALRADDVGRAAAAPGDG